MFKSISIILFLVSLALAAEAWVKGVAQDVYDGDTFKLNENGQIIKIRMFGIDAPEANQKHGKEAGDALRELIDGKEIRIRIENKDVYGRTVGEPWLGDSVNVSIWMLKNGHGWWYKTYSKKRTDFEAAEAEAKAKKLGLWAEEKPMPPWDFRKQPKDNKKKKKEKKKK
jgi:micrococcal nuclease